MRIEYIELCNKILGILTLMVLPAMIGIILLSEEIVILISDETYIESRHSLAILGVSLVACLYNWFFSSCVLVPNKKEKTVLFATIIAAVVNIGLNFILIPLFDENGAAITTLIAEMCSLIICGIYSKQFFRFKIEKKNIVTVLTGCVYIIIVCCFIKKLFLSNILRLIISMFLSVVGYFFIEIILKNNIALDSVNRIKTRIGR